MLSNGDEPLGANTEAARSHRLDAAQITAVGAFAQAEVGYFDRDQGSYSPTVMRSGSVRWARCAWSIPLVLSAGLLAACSGGPDDSAAAPASPSAGISTNSSRPATAGPNLDAPQELVTGIDVPWGVAFLPGGDALISERDSGRILQLPAQGGKPRQVYRVPGVAAQGEGGLLGLAVSPDYTQDRYVYAYFTSRSDNRIVRFRLDDDSAPEVIFQGLAKANVHNGGRIAFGPDGMLYVGTGDATRRELAQDPDSPNGKILRLTPSGESAPGNPTDGSPVYSLGHRNVQGLTWDSQDRLWAIEFGQDRYDEVNLIKPGDNDGWPQVEGKGDTQGGKFTNPLVVWGTDKASPSGATIIGDTLYVAALKGERLWTVPLDGEHTGEPAAELDGKYGRLRTAVAAPDGSLWLTTSNTDGRGQPRDGDDRILRFPAS
ncbi:PQQ-dependent sugar dehydrogenase [Actinoplanes sp. Pm04-4]|uniref:PQQ-dependent sugar dehydrogenase n=1 Tax=Paractinoplanes pyxinae TaxID=2997416 RepID=A0ABT4BB43_9ACTN|nr:PQQ-dependent sugar dehydrogenase [Actinoplanes pyxinae]MCY1143739.1 PQQ-dependent sugar dehydrogenase [Actinoplanes pyxinae]